MTASGRTASHLVDRPDDGRTLQHCVEQGLIDVPLELVLDTSGRLWLDPQVENGDYFAVSLKRGRLSLRARGYVGYLPLNDRVAVYVHPRVPIGNLSHLIRTADEPPTVLTSLRGYTVNGEWSDTLVDVYASALSEHVDAISASGLHREYVRREATSSFPHGRVLISRTQQRLFPRGVRHAAAISWFERSVDTPANRCIKYAMWLLAREFTFRGTAKRSRSRRLRQALNARYPVFDGVTLDHRRAFLADPVVSGAQPLPTVRSYYRDALNVAQAVIARESVAIDEPGEAIRLPSMVLDMNRVFERYVRSVLRTSALAAGWPITVLDGKQHSTPLFWDAASREATPDIILRSDGTTVLVLEVKNIPKVSREAINQAVTYAASYRLREVVLVLPRMDLSSTPGMSLIGHAGDIAVYLYRFDLATSDLASEENRFGKAVGSLLGEGQVT